MKSRFSEPIPCSPVIMPPAATQTSRISEPAASTRASSSGSRRSKEMFGCRLPSPAWKTFERRRRWRSPIAQMRSSTSGQARARNHRVVHVEVGCQPTHRAEGALARAPESLTLCGVACHLDPRGSARGRDLADAQDLRGQGALRPVHLDQQDGAGIQGKAGGVDARLHRGDRALIDDLERCGHQARLDHAAHRAAGGNDVWEDREQGLDALRDRLEPHRHLGHDAERALAPDHRSDQVIAAAEAGARAELDHLPVRQHQLQAEHVLGGGPVLERVRPTRVLGDVAADRADQLTGWIGRVEEAVRRGGLRELGVHDTGLDHRAAVDRMDPDDAIHARALDHDAAALRDGAAREAGARPARHEGHPELAAGADHAADLVPRAREHHRRRLRPVERQPVALVDQQLFGSHQAGVRSDDPAQALHQPGHGVDRTALPDDSARPRPV